MNSYLDSFGEEFLFFKFSFREKIFVLQITFFLALGQKRAEKTRNIPKFNPQHNNSTFLIKNKHKFSNSYIEELKK